MLEVLCLDEDEDAEDAKDDTADPAPIPPPILSNGRLAPPRDLPSRMTDEDTS